MEKQIKKQKQHKAREAAKHKRSTTKLHFNFSYNFLFSQTTMKLILTSGSKIKTEALRKSNLIPDDLRKCELIPNNICPDDNVVIINKAVDGPAGCENPEQPLGRTNTLVCCKRRVEWVIEQGNLPDDLDLIVGIENGIVVDPNNNKDVFDIVQVVVFNMKTGLFSNACGGDFRFEKRYYNIAQRLSDDQFKTETLGIGITCGELIAKDLNSMGIECDSKNPHVSYQHPDGKQNTIDRQDQIVSVINKIKKSSDFIAANIDYFVDYPEEGVVFKSLDRILAHQGMSHYFYTMCLNSVITDDNPNYDYVVGLDARGFIIGSAIAARMDNNDGCGFVMIRKKGKMPGETFEVSYNKEYGSVETFCLRKGIIPPKSKVLVVDDLLATGGSMVAAVKLLRNIPELDITCFAPLVVEKLFDKARQSIKSLNVPFLTLKN